MAADQLAADEVVLLDLARCAVLRAPVVPSGKESGPALNPQLSYRAVSPRARTVSSLGIEELVRRSRVVTGEGGAMAQDAEGAGWAWPARLELTDRRLLGIGPPGTVWTWALVDLTEVVHSATEPCTVVRHRTKPDCALLVPLADADAFRRALDQALRTTDEPGPGEKDHPAEPPAGGVAASVAEPAGAGQAEPAGDGQVAEPAADEQVAEPVVNPGIPDGVDTGPAAAPPPPQGRPRRLRWWRRSDRKEARRAAAEAARVAAAEAARVAAAEAARVAAAEAAGAAPVAEDHGSAAGNGHVAAAVYDYAQQQEWGPAAPPPDPGPAAAYPLTDPGWPAGPMAATALLEAPTLDGSLTTTTLHAGETGELPPRRKVRAIPGFGDRVFHGWSWLGGLSVLAIMALVGLFLLIRALTALRATGLSFLTTSEWQPDTHHFGIAAVLTGTVLIALVALAVSIPLAIGTALFISEAAPRVLKQWFISMVDLMAAVPSIVYGLWGLFFFQSHVIGVSRWISTWFAWIPIFQVQGADPNNPLASKSVYTASTFIAGVVVALMVIPISCSIMREVFSQAPAGEREGAYALGATRWGMIRSVVLPFGKGGMIGAVMLGLGRALGETIAVYLIISPVFTINFHILQTGSNSVASLIVLRNGDASGFGLSALMAAGLSLFVLTLIVNFSASAMVARSRSGAQSEA